MKKCIKCQREINDNARFCIHCGTRQPETAAAPQPIQQPQAAPKPYQEKPVAPDMAFGKDEAITQVRRLVSFYESCKQEGRLKQRPEMDLLVLGNSGTGKSFLIETIHQMMLRHGILTNPRIKKVDASEYNSWIGSLNDKAIGEMRGQLLLIDNVQLLMSDTEHLTPIDRLLALMEDWERDGSSDWYTYPIVIFAGIVFSAYPTTDDSMAMADVPTTAAVRSCTTALPPSFTRFAAGNWASWACS